MARASLILANSTGTFHCTCGNSYFCRIEGGYECQRCNSTWREAKPEKPRKRPQSDAPEHVKAAKLELRRLGAEEREVRKRWLEARAKAPSGAAENLAMTDYTPSDLVAGRVGVLTLALWAAEHAREQSAARWRLLLAEREVMPVAERWNQADLTAWASWSPEVL